LLAIRALDTEVVLGSAIDIEIKITNTSEEVLAMPFGNHGGLPDGYKWDVRTEQDGPVAKLAARTDQLPDGQTWRVPPHPAGSILNGQLEPGKTITQGARINNAYKFDHPGNYTIQVSRTVPGSPTVYSNTITITVLPKPEADEPK
jgi:hypothetical protein